MALDAVAGRTASQRLVLSLLDAETAKESAAEAEADTRELADLEADALSLLQGKMQRNGIECLEDILWPGQGVKALEADELAETEQHSEPAATAPASAQNKAPSLSLLQGKNQGNEKKQAKQICAALNLSRTPDQFRARPDNRTGLMMSTAHDVFPIRACAAGR